MDSLGQYFIELKEFIGSLLCARYCNDLWWYKEGTSLRNSQPELGGYTEKLTVTNALIQLSPGYSGDTRAGWLIQHRVCPENFVGELSLQERMGISQIETRKFFWTEEMPVQRPRHIWEHGVFRVLHELLCDLRVRRKDAREMDRTLVTKNMVRHSTLCWLLQLAGCRWKILSRYFRKWARKDEVWRQRDPFRRLLELSNNK